MDSLLQWNSPDNGEIQTVVIEPEEVWTPDIILHGL
jgi:hypothetical protein